MRKDKKQAIKLRQSGYSYNEISKKLKIPKSTLSGWFSRVNNLRTITKRNIEKAKKRWAANIIAYNKHRAKLAHKAWRETQNEAIQEIKKLSKQDLKLVGSALYWAEGYKRGKWNVIFCNSDPSMIRLMMKFFQKICKIPISKIKVQIQLYPNISVKSATNYWSGVTKLSFKQFLKPICQISRSSKLKRKNTLPFGTLRIKINDVKLVNKIKGWISGLHKNI